MTVLRILVAADGDPVGWALFDATGKLLDRGTGASSNRPRAERTEAIVAASQVRTFALSLPPLVPARRIAAARYALEDRLATPIDDAAIALSQPDGAGNLHAVVLDRALLEMLGELDDRVDRVLAEPDLAPARATWTWYRSGTGGTFVTTPDGGAFALDAQDAASAMAQFAAALRDAARNGRAPERIDVAFAVDDATLAGWRDATDVTFSRIAQWRWDEAGREAFDNAIDLRTSLGPARTGPSRRTTLRLFRPAIALTVLAIALQFGATLAQWLGLRWQEHRAEQTLLALAREANLPVADADSAATALAQRYSQQQHRAGLAAPEDALPLLARVAPVLGTMPGRCAPRRIRPARGPSKPRSSTTRRRCASIAGSPAQACTRFRPAMPTVCVCV